jgi:IS605 OrfB family transposase
LLSDVQTKYKQTVTNKSKLEDKILQTENKIKSLEKITNKTKKEKRLLFKLNNKLVKQNKRLPKDIVFGGKHNLKKISYLHNQINNNLNINENTVLLNKYKSDYTNDRIQQIYLIGEANQKGNRFFDFSNLTNNQIIYKPFFGKKIILNLIEYKNLKERLSLLSTLIENKEISITVRFDNESISLIYDESILSGYKFDEKKKNRLIKEIKQCGYGKEIEDIKITEICHQLHNELKELKYKGKLKHRCVALDLNPNYIGLSVLDKIGNNEVKVIAKYQYDLSDINSKDNHKKTNKRKHIIIHIIRDIFKKIYYYKAGNLVIEDLDFDDKSLDSKEGNRQVKNLWNRELILNLINKNCNLYGINLIKTNAAYSSFVGNLVYGELDPISASIEIGRRGLYQYDIGKSFYPVMNIDTVITALCRLTPSIDGVMCDKLRQSNNWVTLYRLVHSDELIKSGLRYRVKYCDVNPLHYTMYNLNKLNCVVFNKLH